MAGVTRVWQGFLVFDRDLLGFGKGCKGLTKVLEFGRDYHDLAGITRLWQGLPGFDYHLLLVFGKIY